jgi:hypothetical protein
MKKRLLLGLFTLISLNVWADDPDYNTTTGIVTFPRVSVNNSTSYINAKLLLDPDGTWSILEAELENVLSLTGDWNGVLNYTEEPFFGMLMTCEAHTQVSLIQSGNELTGQGSLTGDCINEHSGNGMITGKINGNEISFEIALDTGVVNYRGTISHDYSTLSVVLNDLMGLYGAIKLETWLLSK